VGRIVLEFDIHPVPGGKIGCFVWDTRDQMLAATSHRFKEKNYEACFVGYRWVFDENGLKPGRLGNLHFYADKMGAGIVSHEIQHFVLGWVSALVKFREGYDINDHDDIEEVCLMAGDITKEFWNKYYENCGIIN
jgi:hypothetical protein